MKPIHLTPATLYGRAVDDIKLEHALRAVASVFDGADAVALLYSARKCQLARLRAGALTDSHEQAVDLNGIFEARIFNEKAEFRWLNRQDGQGRAVLLSEEPIPESAESRFNIDVTLDAVDRRPQSYLLWGEGVGLESNGWATLTTARLGNLSLPISNLGTGRAQLRSVEYFAEADVDGVIVQTDYDMAKNAGKLHGNVILVEERLLGLEVAK